MNAVYKNIVNCTGRVRSLERCKYNAAIVQSHLRQPRDALSSSRDGTKMASFISRCDNE